MRFASVALALLVSLSVSAGEPQYDFPLFASPAPTWTLPPMIALVKGKLPVPDYSKGPTPENVAVMRQVLEEALRIAEANMDECPEDVPPLGWRRTAIYAAKDGVLAPFFDGGVGEEVVTSVMDAFGEEIARAMTEEEIDSVKDRLDDYSKSNLFRRMMAVGICRKEWGAHALLYGRENTGIVPEFWRLYLETAGEKLAYEALAEAIFNSPIETVIWSPGSAPNMSWLSQYAFGYVQGHVPEPVYRDFLARLKERAMLARLYYIVRGHSVYASLVDQWFVGRADAPAIILQFDSVKPAS